MRVKKAILPIAVACTLMLLTVTLPAISDTHPGKPTATGKLAMASAPQPVAPDNTSSANRLDASWKNGKAGHDSAVGSRLEHKKPVLVYFYTDWCPYCKKLDTTVLNSPRVVEALKNVEKVRINPEKGAQERSLANQYGVTHYPSLFIITPRNATPRYVNSHWSEDSFIAELEASR